MPDSSVFIRGKGKKMKSDNKADEIHQHIIGSSEIMMCMKCRIARIARFPWPVLILGESGTGKELAAKAVHDLSPRRKNPFVPVNCAGLPDTLAESEFFGYEKGAFTDAKSQRTGKFQEAASGILFLDEIGEASTKLQLTLLRALESGRVMRVGSAKEEAVNVRLICATNKPVQELMSDMRTDLFQRISTYPLYVPPLRQHREDIQELIRHFIRQFRSEFDDQAENGDRLNISEIDKNALSFLATLNFHGNVRELRNILQRAAMLADPEEIALTEACVREAVNLIPRAGHDISGQGLRYLYEWAVSNQHRFWNRHRKENRPPPGGWAGRWDIKRILKGPVRNSPEDDNWKQICFTNGAVTDLLDDGEFEKKVVIQEWTERGWINGTKNSPTTTCRINDQTTRVYCFRRSVIEAHCIRIGIHLRTVFIF